MAGDQWDEQVGSVAEEAQRLLETLRRAGGDPPQGPPEPSVAGDRDDDADAGEWTCTDPFCRACPLCRTVAVVRGLSPETLRRLADLAAVAASVLTDLAGDRAAADPPAASEQARSRRPPTAGPMTSRPVPVRDLDEEEDARG